MLLGALPLVVRAGDGQTVDINEADAATLDRVLVGVGPSRAEAIVRYRDQHGPFESLEDLDQVRGIGPATLERNRARILIDGAPAEATPAE